MSLAHDTSAQWSPRGFDDYRARFPATAPLRCDDQTQGFVAAWECHADPADRRSALWSLPQRPKTTVIFARGYLGHYMPNNLMPARDALRRSGWRAVIADNDAGGPIAGNIERLLIEIARAPEDHGVVLCGHSRGGLEALWAAERSPRPVRAVILSQTPRGRSWVLESVLTRKHPRHWRRRFAEEAQRLGLIALRARRGGLELAEIERHVQPLLAPWSARRPYPVVQTASWSSRPTTWLDSFHERLSELRPGVAHDGQFYLEDLLWPAWGHVLLPHLDHAQPAMDGFGFDSGRYWQTLLLWVLAGA
jgi:pimeloyl-ACP methyl ester carboxylesterase